MIYYKTFKITIILKDFPIKKNGTGKKTPIDTSEHILKISSKRDRTVDLSALPMVDCHHRSGNLNLSDIPSGKLTYPLVN